MGCSRTHCGVHANQTTSFNIVERSIKTLKSKLFGLIDSGQAKYIDLLPKVINGINNTAGRMTKLSPNNVTPLTVGDARMNIYDYNMKQENKFLNKKETKPPPKYQVDDYAGKEIIQKRA